MINGKLPQTAVKCRFFAQYWGVNCFQNIMNEKNNYETYSQPFMNESDMDGQFCKLKPLSNYTKEDSLAVEKIWRASDERVEAYFINSYPNTLHDDREIVGRSLIKYWLEKDKLNFQNRIDYRTIQHITDYLRSKGYALPFMEYSVENLVSFGWVQLS